MTSRTDQHLRQHGSVVPGCGFTCSRRTALALTVSGLLPGISRGQNAIDPDRVDQSIARAIRYLAAAQRPSGAWTIHNQEACAATSLAIMAFMAAGHVPGEGPYGIALERGIRFVLGNQAGNGVFIHRSGNGPMYTHGISTLMLAEVVGMVDEQLARQVRPALERAVLVILKAQAVRKGPQHAGGWRYEPTSSDSDLSVTGWQLLALRASRNIGCDVPVESIEFAVDYVKRCAVPRGGGFSYHPGHGVSPTRSGTGILCLEICGEHHAAETMAAADYLLSSPLQYDSEWFFYGVYYCTVGMFQVGGRYWEFTRDHIGNILLTHQNQDGSWAPTRNEAGNGPNYSTAMAVLALAVDYQYLPIYQR